MHACCWRPAASLRTVARRELGHPGLGQQPAGSALVSLSTLPALDKAEGAGWQTARAQRGAEQGAQTATHGTLRGRKLLLSFGSCPHHPLAAASHRGAASTPLLAGRCSSGSTVVLLSALPRPRGGAATLGLLLLRGGGGGRGGRRSHSSRGLSGGCGSRGGGCGGDGRRGGCGRGGGLDGGNSGSGGGGDGSLDLRGKERVGSAGQRVSRCTCATPSRTLSTAGGAGTGLWSHRPPGAAHGCRPSPGAAQVRPQPGRPLSLAHQHVSSQSCQPLQPPASQRAPPTSASLVATWALGASEGGSLAPISLVRGMLGGGGKAEG
jgi:hypothetical protein